VRALLFFRPFTFRFPSYQPIADMLLGAK
jgi:hypothetical protein